MAACLSSGGASRSRVTRSSSGAPGATDVTRSPSSPLGAATLARGPDQQAGYAWPPGCVRHAGAETGEEAVSTSELTIESAAKQHAELVAELVRRPAA